MTNLEQLEMLKTGVSSWNKWRDEHPAIVIDLRKVNLNKASLNGVNFKVGFTRKSGQ